MKYMTRNIFSNKQWNCQAVIMEVMDSVSPYVVMIHPMYGPNRIQQEPREFKTEEEAIEFAKKVIGVN